MKKQKSIIRRRLEQYICTILLNSCLFVPSPLPVHQSRRDGRLEGDNPLRGFLLSSFIVCHDNLPRSGR